MTEDTTYLRVKNDPALLVDPEVPFDQFSVLLR